MCARSNSGKEKQRVEKKNKLIKIRALALMATMEAHMCKRRCGYYYLHYGNVVMPGPWYVCVWTPPPHHKDGSRADPLQMITTACSTFYI